MEAGADGFQDLAGQGGGVAQPVDARLADPLDGGGRGLEEGGGRFLSDGDQAVGGGPAHALAVVVEGLSQDPHGQGRVPHGGELVGGADADRLGGLVAGAEPR